MCCRILLSSFALLCRYCRFFYYCCGGRTYMFHCFRHLVGPSFGMRLCLYCTHILLQHDLLVCCNGIIGATDDSNGCVQMCPCHFGGSRTIFLFSCSIWHSRYFSSWMIKSGCCLVLCDTLAINYSICLDIFHLK